MWMPPVIQLGSLCFCNLVKLLLTIEKHNQLLCWETHAIRRRTTTPVSFSRVGVNQESVWSRPHTKVDRTMEESTRYAITSCCFIAYCTNNDIRCVCDINYKEEEKLQPLALFRLVWMESLFHSSPNTTITKYKLHTICSPRYNRRVMVLDHSRHEILDHRMKL